MPEAKVAAVLLAAGGSARFGQPKQLLDWNGRPMIAHVAGAAWSAGLDPVIVALGAEAERIQLALRGYPVQILRNYRWETGMSASLNLGVSALPPETEAAIFLQVDQPFVTPQLLRALIERWQASRAAIVVPTWEGRYGSPVLFTRALFPELAQLTGDIGGRALFAPHAGQLATLPVAAPQLLADADTPEQYAQLQSLAQQDAAAILRPIRALVVDMDGVLWRGGIPLPGLHEFFALIRRLDLRYTLVTNNSSRAGAECIAKLAQFGIACESEHVLTAADGAAAHLAEIAPPGAPVYAVGGPGVMAALRARGFQLTDGSLADYVVVGWNPQLTWDLLNRAALLIRRGAAFIGTNPDRCFPLEDGLVPGAGAQLAFLETATDVTPTVVGKPGPILYRQALARMGATPAETLAVGDRLDTDILGGLRLGMPTAMLLSGVQTQADVQQSPIHPDLVFEDLAALVAAWPA